MNRRDVLRGAGATVPLALAGCLERLGFEETSAWADVPVVEDRPDAVYLPAAREEMGTYGAASHGDLGVVLTYTFPHRFWLVRDDAVSEVTIEEADTHHLMVDVWDRETETVLPVDVYVELFRDGEVVEEFAPWPMLSQRMGFHYGENAQLPGEGVYTARIHVGGLEATALGAFEGRFEEGRSVDVEFEYRHADIHDLSFDEIERDRRGGRDALPLMDHADHAEEGHDHGEHDHDDHAGHDDAEHPDHGNPGHPPTSRVPAVDALPGDHLGTDQSADATFVTVLTTVADEPYLAVSVRTPHNEVVLPGASLEATVEREGEVVAEPSLREALHEDLGHHYGAPVDAIESGDQVRIQVRSPPHVTRHDGYETAFLDFEDVVLTR